MQTIRYFIFSVFLLAVACKEETTPLVSPNDHADDQNDGEDDGVTDTPPANNCTVKAFTPVTGKYADCLPKLSNTTLDIVTWNIENFPKEDEATISLLKEIIATLDADILAFQEIGSVSDFTGMISAIEGWSSVVKGSGSQRVGYAYKTAEVTLSNTTELFAGDNSAFPRRPLMTTAKHVSGKEVTLINLHLKCCDDGNSIPRRKDAAQKLKDYIDQNLSTTAVVMLGDMNEDITQPEGNGVFTNFVTDSTHYWFADMSIATCDKANWSYPSWPSHLDHMLVTNELFNNVSDIRTLKPNTCDARYFSTVTDHCPVLMRLKF